MVLIAQMEPGQLQALLNAEFALPATTAKIKQLFHPQFVLMVPTRSEVTLRALFVQMLTSVISVKLWHLALFGTMLIARLVAIACHAPMATTAPRVLRNNVLLEPTVQLKTLLVLLALLDTTVELVLVRQQCALVVPMHLVELPHVPLAQLITTQKKVTSIVRQPLQVSRSTLTLTA
jgi:type IV secretory pathway TrbD component